MSASFFFWHFTFSFQPWLTLMLRTVTVNYCSWITRLALKARVGVICGIVPNKTQHRIQSCKKLINHEVRFNNYQSNSVKFLADELFFVSTNFTNWRQKHRWEKTSAWLNVECKWSNWHLNKSKLFLSPSLASDPPRGNFAVPEKPIYWKQLKLVNGWFWCSLTHKLIFSAIVGPKKEKNR